MPIKFKIIDSYWVSDMERASNELVEAGYKFVGSQGHGNYYVMFFELQEESDV